MPFPAVDLIGVPDNATALAQLPPAPRAGVDLLVVYDGEYPFLERVLNAAGYDDPAVQTYLLAWSPADGGVDLARLLRRFGVTRVLLFGQQRRALGLHFSVADYFAVTVAGVTYLCCPAVAEIAAAKAAGDNGPAGLLWRAVKEGFLRR